MSLQETRLPESFQTFFPLAGALVAPVGTRQYQQVSVFQCSERREVGQLTGSGDRGGDDTYCILTPDSDLRPHPVDLCAIPTSAHAQSNTRLNCPYSTILLLI